MLMYIIYSSHLKQTLRIIDIKYLAVESFELSNMEIKKSRNQGLI